MWGKGPTTEITFIDGNRGNICTSVFSYVIGPHGRAVADGENTSSASASKLGRIVLPPSDVKLMSYYFRCASYFWVINSTHKDALGTLLKDCDNEIYGHRPNFVPDLHLSKHRYWGKAPMVGGAKRPLLGALPPHDRRFSPCWNFTKFM